MAKNEYYRNFSNRESFNGVPCRSDEELVPAVLTKEMKVTQEELSLDEFLDNIDDEDGKGFDPTGTTENEGKAMLLMAIEILINELSSQDENMGKIIKLLADGFQKKEILDQVDLGKGKTQGYAFIEKTQKIALKLYNDKFRD